MMDESVGIILFCAAVLIVGGLLFVMISLSKNSPKNLDQAKYQDRWFRIERELVRDVAATHSLCILNADKLLDQALRDRGLPGKTMAERMKQFQGKWTNGNGVWAAHKLRNRLAHEADASVDYERAKQALVAYKQALKDVGAI